MSTVLARVDESSPTQLNHIMQGFRNKENKGLYQRVRKTLVDRKDQLKLKDEELINLFFMFASSKPRNFGNYRVYAAEDLDELLAFYEHDLCEAAENADAEHLTRVAQAMYILKTRDYPNIWWRIERRANQLASEDKLEPYHLVNILRAFSRAQQNSLAGSEKTFVHLEKYVLKSLGELSARDLTHVMYAYGVRGAGNPELHTAFLKHISTKVAELDYPALHNLVYYLLFRENTNEALWRDVVQTTIDQEELLPLIYYKPFKVAREYCHFLFPHWNDPQPQSGTFLSDFRDKFYYAEKYFNVVKFDDNYEREQDYLDFRAFMTGHCNVYPTPFMTHKNMFTLHFTFLEQKICIFFHLNKFCKPDKTASEMQKLPGKVLRLDDWEVLDLTEAEFKSWNYDQRVSEIKGWLKAAK